MEKKVFEKRYNVFYVFASVTLVATYAGTNAGGGGEGKIKFTTPKTPLRGYVSRNGRSAAVRRE